jgi:hypothetical protein
MNRTPKTLLEELAGVGVSLPEMNQMAGAPAANGSEKSAQDGEIATEGLKKTRKQIGGAARIRKIKRRKYYRAHKSEIKRGNRQYRRSASGKRNSRLRKRLAPKINKMRSSAPDGVRISLSDTGISSNLAERIRMESVSAGVGKASGPIAEAYESFVRGADLALEMMVRYGASGSLDVANEMGNLAEALMDLADRAEASSAVEGLESLEVEAKGAFKGLNACLEDYFRNRYGMGLGDDSSDED